jgi:hypothetical protein
LPSFGEAVDAFTPLRYRRRVTEGMMTNRLYYGDNLDRLANRQHFPDPPFSSNATYSQLFIFSCGRKNLCLIEKISTLCQKQY